MTPFERGFLKQACSCGLTEAEAHRWLYKFSADLDIDAPYIPASLPSGLKPYTAYQPVPARLANVFNPTPVTGMDWNGYGIDAARSSGRTSGGMSSMMESMGGRAGPKYLNNYSRNTITDVMGQRTPSAPYGGAILGAQHAQMPKPSLNGLALQSANAVARNPERLIRGGLVGGATAAGLDYFAPTPENNGSYWHDVLNQVNDSTKSIVGGGTTGALLGGGVGAVPGAIGGGIYDLAQKAMTGGRDLWDTGKMKLEAAEQQQAIAAMEAQLGLSQKHRNAQRDEHVAARNVNNVAGEGEFAALRAAHPYLFNRIEGEKVP